jgi:hypothetical protein
MDHLVYSGHERAAPRTLVTPAGQVRNLDDELRTARFDQARAEEELEYARRRVRALEAEVANWDRAHG